MEKVNEGAIPNTDESRLKAERAKEFREAFPHASEEAVDESYPPSTE